MTYNGPRPAWAGGPLEVDLHAELPETRLQHAGRHQPLTVRERGARQYEILVVAEHCRGVEDVVGKEGSKGGRGSGRPKTIRRLRAEGTSIPSASSQSLRLRLDRVRS